MSLTPNQRLYSKEVKRIKAHIERLKKEGLTIKQEIPEQPKRITQKDIAELKAITPKVLRQTAEPEKTVTKQTDEQLNVGRVKHPEISGFGKGGNRTPNINRRVRNAVNKNIKQHKKEITKENNKIKNSTPNTKASSVKDTPSNKAQNKSKATKPEIKSTEVYPTTWQAAFLNQTIDMIDKFAMPAPRAILTDFITQLTSEVGADKLADAMYQAQENGFPFYEAILYDSTGEEAQKYSLRVLHYIDMPDELKDTWRIMLGNIDDYAFDDTAIVKGKIFTINPNEETQTSIKDYMSTQQISIYVEQARRNARKNR